MESGEKPDQFSSEQGVEKADENSEINLLPELLGFAETLEMTLLRAAAMDAYDLGDEEQAREFHDRYQIGGEQMLDRLYGDKHARAKIALIVALGNLRRDTGRVAAYVNDLEDAVMYAEGIGYHGIIPVLERASTVDQNMAEGLGGGVGEIS